MRPVRMLTIPCVNEEAQTAAGQIYALSSQGDLHKSIPRPKQSLTLVGYCGNAVTEIGQELSHLLL